MSYEFTLHFQERKQPKVYRLEASPRLTQGMCAALASSMLSEKGGYAVRWVGPDGIHGSEHGKTATEGRGAI